MRIVLLSGGSGKRLWPLSNDVRSKQFLKLLKNKDVKQLNFDNHWLEEYLKKDE